MTWGRRLVVELVDCGRILTSREFWREYAACWSLDAVADRIVPMGRV